MATDFEKALAREWPRLKGVVPDHIDEARLARIAAEAIKRVPKLGQCSVESLIDAVLTCAQLGLEPDGTGRIYLVPRWNSRARKNEAQVMVGYRGMIELARRSGQIENIEAHVVFENDDFFPRLGTEPRIDHIPAMKDRGGIIGAYCVIWTTGASRPQHEILTAEDLEKIRAAADPKSFAWKDWPEEMVRNSALKRGLKRAPADSELRMALGVVDQAEGIPVEDVLPGAFDGQRADEADPWAGPAKAADDMGHVDSPPHRADGRNAMADEPPPDDEVEESAPPPDDEFELPGV